jgi:hypothetical protein
MAIDYEALGKGVAAAVPFNGHLGLKLDAEGKVSFPIEVELTDSDHNTVATATVRWHVRRNA